jgi:hypothetical protein
MPVAVGCLVRLTLAAFVIVNLLLASPKTNAGGLTTAMEEVPNAPPPPPPPPPPTPETLRHRQRVALAASGVVALLAGTALTVTGGVYVGASMQRCDPSNPDSFGCDLGNGFARGVGAITLSVGIPGLIAGISLIAVGARR